MNKKNLRFTSILAVLALSACTQGIGMGSEIERGPVDVGPSVKELKSSPCACTEIPMNLSFADLT
jgi:hypothetical protein